VILIILAAIIIALAEGVPLIKKRLWRELGIFFCLILLAVFIGIAKELDITSPAMWLHQLIGPAGEVIFKGVQ